MILHDRCLLLRSTSCHPGKKAFLALAGHSTMDTYYFNSGLRFHLEVDVVLSCFFPSSFTVTVCLGIGGRVLQGSLSPVVIEHWCVIAALDPLIVFLSASLGPCLRLSPSFDFGSGWGGMVDFGFYLCVEYMPELLVSLLSLASLLLLVSLRLSYTGP